MANLQIKNLPEHLHDALRERAVVERTTISTLVTEMIERQLRVLSLEQWLTNNRQARPKGLNIDAGKILDQVRAEYAGD